MCDIAVEKDSKMLKFVPDYFETQEMCEKTVKNSLFTIIHVLDQHKTEQIREKFLFQKILKSCNLFLSTSKFNCM